MQAEPRAPQLTENVFAQALELGVLEHILVQFGDIGIRFPGLFIIFYGTQQPAELFTVDGVCVGFCGGKAP